MSTIEQIKFESTWREVESKINGYFIRRGCSRNDIDDLTQEVAVRAWKNFHRIKGEFKPYAFGIAKYVYINYINDKANFADDDRIALVADSSLNPSQESEVKELIDTCLETLDPIDRECLTLHDLHGQNFEEISRILGISRSNAHYHIEKARKLLRETFPELLESQRT